MAKRTTTRSRKKGGNGTKALGGKRVWNKRAASSIIHFTFETTGTGNFAAWEVVYLGQDRAQAKRRVTIKDSINKGFTLMVVYKVWGGDHAITYTCKDEAGKEYKGEPPTPINGLADTDKPRTIKLYIPF
ncbi:MAG: hypothetical protein JNL05_11980 [Flavobacteriales bacterium]|nr:hypothetical protein [Flavobacteriales bacterium]